MPIFSFMNLYVHFPFCRSKCAYCALYSVVGRDEPFRNAYAQKLARAIEETDVKFKTVYFGGGTPAMCDLSPLFKTLKNRIDENTEWTIELNPMDVNERLLYALKEGGVNRISMGVQSLDDATLASMARRHTSDDAIERFNLIRECGFKNVGIDLIVGWQTFGRGLEETIKKMKGLDINHCSVYSLIREKGTMLEKRIERGEITLPEDDKVLDDLLRMEEELMSMGLHRYEISNYAKPGMECKHNLAVWRGEDYWGIGAGAHGRIGRVRSVGDFENIVPVSLDGKVNNEKCCEVLSGYEDNIERALFSMRTHEGFNIDDIAEKYPILKSRADEWNEKCSFFVKEGLLYALSENHYRLTRRGFEVCDAILSELQ